MSAEQAASMQQLRLNSLEIEKKQLMEKCAEREIEIGDLRKQLEECQDQKSVLQEKYDQALVSVSGDTDSVAAFS